MAHAIRAGLFQSESLSKAICVVQHSWYGRNLVHEIVPYDTPLVCTKLRPDHDCCTMQLVFLKGSRAQREWHGPCFIAQGGRMLAYFVSCMGRARHSRNKFRISRSPEVNSSFSGVGKVRVRQGLQEGGPTHPVPTLVHTMAKQSMHTQHR